uniref:glutathione transferase n=1 Tax=Anopheles stephensi TaxID=30069 RepID=A0A182YT50_ANOST
MPNIKLYTAKLSPPGRAVELTAKLLGLQLDIVPINLLAGDHRKDEFLKMNPQWQYYLHIKQTFGGGGD